MSTIAVLGYHKVGPPVRGGWDTWFYVPRPKLDADLSWLLEEGWVAIGLRQLVAGLDDPGTLPDRSFVVTFDDGCRSVLEVAAPVLEKLGCPAIAFVPTAHVGSSTAAFDDVEPDEPTCTWDELRRLEQAGVAIQSHGVTHRAFSDLGLSEQRAECEASKAEIEARLGRPVELMAYPYGDSGGRPAELRCELERTGYKAAFTYPGGSVELPPADRYRLPRIAVGPDTELATELGAAGG